MALAVGTIFLNKNFVPSSTNFSGAPKFPYPYPDSKTHFRNLRRYFTIQRLRFPAAKIHASSGETYGVSQDQVNANGGANLDTFLTAVEFLSLASSAVVSVYIAVRCGIQNGGGGLGLLGSKILVWQYVMVVSGVAAGAVIRRRQWGRICGVRFSRGPDSYRAANLLDRVEKLEADLVGSTKNIQALARRLEKLGIRFRVTRKALKEPIAEVRFDSLECLMNADECQVEVDLSWFLYLWVMQVGRADYEIVIVHYWDYDSMNEDLEYDKELVVTAALVQKNSEATRLLAAQEGILEKELGEIQKEQQHKQLELILAVAKAGKLWEPKRVKSHHQESSGTCNRSVAGAANTEPTLTLQKEANNDRP
ncbi:hypothetical protein OROGR_019065 [Orobanche gracilis]